MKLASTYPIRVLCRWLAVPRSSVYYAARPPVDDAMLKTALLDVADVWLPSVDRDDEATRLARER